MFNICIVFCIVHLCLYMYLMVAHLHLLCILKHILLLNVNKCAGICQFRCTQFYSICTTPSNQFLYWFTFCLFLAIYTFCRCLGLYTCVFAYMCIYVLYIAQESWYAHQHVEYLLSQSYLFCSVYNLSIFDCISYYIYLRASWKISLFAKCCHPHKIKSLLTYLID